MGGIRHILFTLFIFCFFMGMKTDCFGQDPDKPDLRESCGICKGNARNYSLLNVYFSNATGNPIPDICNNTEPLFISILYSSNSQNAIHNVRLIADIVKKDRRNPNAAPLSKSYINEFIGTVDPCPDGTCIFSIPLPADFVPQCVNEFYELSEPLVAWTPQNRNNLENSYDCQNYPNAQCLNQPSILIDVGDLSYSFEPVFNCFSGDVTQTNVSFVITSLFGGNPTLPYTTEWVFSYPGGPSASQEFSPVLLNMESGTIINASLKVSQGSLTENEIFQQVTVPSALSYEEVIQGNPQITHTNEGTANGIIDVTFLDKDLFYFWTALDDELFYSENSRIENLHAGTYKLTTINNETGTCRTDLFDVSANILPVEYVYTRTNYNSKARTSLISWATGKERESSHFEIQRSIGALTDFKKIGVVIAMGWKDSISEYEFIDEDLPLFGGIVLYRIKQVDINETYAYSDVMSTRMPEVEAKKGVWRAYPNPTNGEQLRIGLLDRSQYEAEQINFRLIHPTVQSQVTTVASESEMNEALATMIGQIPKGVFVVEIQWGQKVEHIKVLKP